MRPLGPTDALLLIDIQRDFLPGGALAVPEGDAVIVPANRLTARFDHVIATQDWHPPGHASFASTHPGKRPFETTTLHYGTQTLWPDHCIVGGPGADFAPGLDLARVELVLRKGFRPGIDSYSAFFENDRTTPTGLHGYLRERGLTRLFLAGLARDYCVHYSALDAATLGYDVTIIEDACRAIAPATIPISAAGRTTLETVLGGQRP